MTAGQAAWVTLAAAFGLFALWETFAPWRRLKVGTAQRWLVNGTLWILGGLLWRGTAGIGAVAVAMLASNGGGPCEWWRYAGTVLLLDLVRYGFHRAVHRHPWFWRVHRVHHSDVELDCTSALRFHPLEAVAGHGCVVGCIYLLGLPPQAVAVSELLTMGVDIAEHANISLGAGWERVLGRVFVTPETHRTHHSADARDYGRNFGTVFVVWDRLLGTHARAPERSLRFGVPEVSEGSSMSLLESLVGPFRK